MMFENLQAKELMLFDAESRKIYLNDKRIILMEADSLGALRRDLIAALGVDRAKAFLLRHGWDYGTNAARTFKSFLPMGREMDWLYTGPHIHEMTGNVRVDVSTLQFDPKTKEYYSEGFWQYSYEAEQHIKHFGLHHEPVCFTLVGFAGGYVSEHLGRRVIFKEVECIGKGDPQCHWIAKPVEDWGDDIEGELMYYSENNLALDLDKAYVRMEHQREMLRRVLTMNEELSKALLRKEGLLGILGILGRHLNASIVFDDPSFQLIESYGAYREHRLAQFLQSDGAHHVLIRRLQHQKRTVRLVVPEQFGWAHVRLISPVLVNNEVAGYLSILKEAGDFDEMEQICLERAATICAISIMNERVALAAEQRVKGQLLDELLVDPAHLESLTYRMKALGYSPNRPHRVYVMEIDDTELRSSMGPTALADPGVGRDKQLSAEQQRQLLDAIISGVRQYMDSPMVSLRFDHIVVLVPVDRLEQLGMTASSFGEVLAQFVSKQFSGWPVRIGISSPCEHLVDYKRGYEEARKALAVTRTHRKKLSIASFDELGLLARLTHRGDIEELRQFADSVLGRLVQYDADHNTELMKTLHHYFEQKGNVLATARAMMLSAGSIKYRLRRIEEICGLQLSESRDFYNTYQALSILIFLGEVGF
jgi:purine catabolism regulator